MEKSPGSVQQGSAAWAEPLNKIPAKARPSVRHPAPPVLDAYDERDAYVACDEHRAY